MQDFMITLLICSVAMSVIALVYMASAPFLAKRYSEKWRYYAWLIIIGGLIIPFRPGWGNTLFNVEVPAAAAPPIVQVSGEVSSCFIPPTSLPPLPPVGLAVWLAGAMVFIVVQGVKHYRFNKAARRWGKSITDTRVLSMLENLKSEMGISRKIPLYLCPIAGSPMMVGLIRPRILLPTAKLAQDELRFILKHELVHYKRKDLLYKYLVVTATALHWFNPIVYLVAKAINNLCETSCDAEVLKSASVETRQFYGETIIGVVKYQSKLKTALSTNFYGGRKGMTKRISSIMDTRSKKAGMIIACLILVLVVGTGFILAVTEQSPSAQNAEVENEIILYSPNVVVQPGLMPGERELGPSENWPLTDDHMTVELFDSNGDIGVRHSADGGETWVGGPALVTLGDDAYEQMTEQERAAWFAETALPRTRDVDFDDVENMAAIFVIPPDEMGEVIDPHNDPEIQAMLQAGVTMEEILAAMLERR